MSTPKGDAWEGDRPPPPPPAWVHHLPERQAPIKRSAIPNGQSRHSQGTNGRLIPDPPADDYLPDSISAFDLMHLELPEPRFAVDGIIPEGLTVLAGKPKLGKSWWALQVALTVATGGVFLGIEVDQGPVLYLALEDTRRRLKNRIQRLWPDSIVPRDLHLFTSFKRQDDGGWMDLVGVVKERQARLVIIDTWAKFRPGKRGNDAYAQDYDQAAEVKRLADDYGVSVLMLHHCRKASAEDVLDEISGTMGLSGAADGILVMRRERGQHDASLFVTGRDVEEKDMMLSQDPQAKVWASLGMAQDYRLSEERREVLDVLHREGPMLPKDIAKAAGKKEGSTRKLLFGMKADGQVIVTTGRAYAIPETTQER